MRLICCGWWWKDKFICNAVHPLRGPSCSPSAPGSLQPPGARAALPLEGRPLLLFGLRLQRLEKMWMSSLPAPDSERSLRQATYPQPPNTRKRHLEELDQAARGVAIGREKGVVVGSDLTEDLLAPTLRKGDIVCMDNLGSHRSKAVRTAIRACGAKLFLLPKYPPDLNPIEQDFAKLKHGLRKAAARSRKTVCRAIGTLLDTYEPAECANYLRNSGYGST
jgi:transposase